MKKYVSKDGTAKIFVGTNLTTAQHERVLALAEKHDKSVSGMLRQLVAKGLERTR